MYGQPAYGTPAFGGHPGSNVPAGVVFASMPRRLGARVLDWLILGFLFTVLGIIVIVVASGSGTFDDYSDSTSTSSQDTAAFLIFCGFVIGTYVLTAIYEVALTAASGATLGKRIVGIKVVREIDGQVPSLGKSALRWLIPVAASLFTCGLGSILVYLSPFFDGTGRLQGWPDKAAGTVVIQP